MTGATRRDYLNAISTDAGLRDRMSEWVGKTFDKLAKERLIKVLESQPVEVQQAAFANVLEIVQSRYRQRERWERRSAEERLEWLLSQSEMGYLVPYDGPGGWGIPWSEDDGEKEAAE